MRSAWAEMCHGCRCHVWRAATVHGLCSQSSGREQWQGRGVLVCDPAPLCDLALGCLRAGAGDAAA